MPNQLYLEELRTSQRAIERQLVNLSVRLRTETIGSGWYDLCLQEIQVHINELKLISKEISKNA
jgi:hypothetical protein